MYQEPKSCPLTPEEWQAYRLTRFLEGVDDGFFWHLVELRRAV
jgi:hypothetical protein